ncbi:MAG: iron-sulfur cluster assembly scaffold protein [Acidobacteria bacterium]|nr:iron-sulfur cluster assembly scaffold protein [Acidobacteriota bacterium]
MAHSITLSIQMYSQTIVEHLANPRNVGELQNPSGRGDVTNEACMDRILLTIKMDAEIITTAKVKAEGCPPTIAAASVLTELIIGRSLDDVARLTRHDVEAALEHLPAMKKHCAALAIDALQSAIDDSRRR